MCTATSWKGAADAHLSIQKDSTCVVRGDHRRLEDGTEVHRDKHGNSFAGTGTSSVVVVMRNGHEVRFAEVEGVTA